MNSKKKMAKKMQGGGSVMPKIMLAVVWLKWQKKMRGGGMVKRKKMMRGGWLRRKVMPDWCI